MMSSHIALYVISQVAVAPYVDDVDRHKQNHQATVFVGGLPPDATHEEVRQYFSAIGAVRSVQLSYLDHLRWRAWC